MIFLLKKIAANRSLLKNLVIRDLKHRYAGSIGGFFWPVIHPLAWLNGAAINSDRNLRMQYLAGFGMDLDESADMLAHRRFPEDLFTGTGARMDSPRKAIQSGVR